MNGPKIEIDAYDADVLVQAARSYLEYARKARWPEPTLMPEHEDDVLGAINRVAYAVEQTDEAEPVEVEQ